MLAHNHWDAHFAACFVKFVVGSYHGACAGRRACDVRFGAEMAAVHVDANQGRAVWVEPRVHLAR
jgi:hypothetical protein